jgi:hypothetical protein
MCRRSGPCRDLDGASARLVGVQQGQQAERRDVRDEKGCQQGRAMDEAFADNPPVYHEVGVGWRTMPTTPTATMSGRRSFEARGRARGLPGVR